MRGAGLHEGGGASRGRRGFAREAGLWGFSRLDAACKGVGCYHRGGLL